MIRVEVETTIDRPIEEIFDRLTNIPGYNRWMPSDGLLSESRQISSGAVGNGTMFKDRIRHGSARGQVVLFNRPTQLAFHQTVKILGMKVLESHPSYTLSPLPDGSTKIHHEAEGYGIGIFRLFEWALKPVARAERRRTVRALKRSFTDLG